MSDGIRLAANATMVPWSRFSLYWMLTGRGRAGKVIVHSAIVQSYAAERTEERAFHPSHPPDAA